ncbi:MAG: RNA polymerase sigma factor [Anaerolineae bacterium]|jgi:RNA polymerase sigma-70 factor (ECF subfamily)|nr:sigma-70 family RNA polymerase sigma factor [Chloroflexota bacterium]
MDTVEHPPTEWDEQAQVRAAQQDPRAFGVLYERHVDRIYSYVYHRVGNVHDAEDLTSRVFFRAMAHIDRYVDRGYPFSAWLYRIAHNLIANWHRDKGRRPVISLEDVVVSSQPEEHPERIAQETAERQLLTEAAMTLDPVRRELLMLKFNEGLSNAEIGQVLGRSEGAIKSLYHRTLLQLRRELEKKGIQIDVDL